MTAPLLLGDLWRETLADTRALMPLALPVAAAFVLLPGVAIDLFGPPLPKTVTALTPNLVVLLLVVPGLIGLLAQAAIVRLAVDRRRGIARSVGEALGAALRLWPLLVVALALTVVPIGIGLLAVVPGLYVAGRLTSVVPLVLDGAGPLAAVERSWALSDGNGWRVFGFLLLLVGWSFVVSAVIGALGAGVAALLKTAGAGGAGAVVASALDGLVAALFAVLDAVAVATVYRRLTA